MTHEIDLEDQRMGRWKREVLEKEGLGKTSRAKEE